MFPLYHVINFAFHLAQGYLWSSLGHCNVKTFFCSLLEEFIGGVVCHWILRVSRRCQSTTQFLYWNCVVLAQRSLMLAFVLDRRVTSTNFLLHPYLRFPHTSSFSAYYAAKQFVLLHWRVSPFASVRSDTPTVTHHGIMPRYPIIDLFS
jgi:hypothetical protein